MSSLPPDFSRAMAYLIEFLEERQLLSCVPTQSSSCTCVSLDDNCGVDPLPFDCSSNGSCYVLNQFSGLNGIPHGSASDFICQITSSGCIQADQLTPAPNGALVELVIPPWAPAGTTTITLQQALMDSAVSNGKAVPLTIVSLAPSGSTISVTSNIGGAQWLVDCTTLIDNTLISLINQGGGLLQVPFGSLFGCSSAPTQTVFLNLLGEISFSGTFQSVTGSSNPLIYISPASAPPYNGHYFPGQFTFASTAAFNQSPFQLRPILGYGLDASGQGPNALPIGSDIVTVIFSNSNGVDINSGASVGLDIDIYSPLYAGAISHQGVAFNLANGYINIDANPENIDTKVNILLLNVGQNSYSYLKSSGTNAWTFWPNLYFGAYNTVPGGMTYPGSFLIQNNPADCPSLGTNCGLSALPGNCNEHGGMPICCEQDAGCFVLLGQNSDITSGEGWCYIGSSGACTQVTVAHPITIQGITQSLHTAFYELVLAIPSILPWKTTLSLPDGLYSVSDSQSQGGTLGIGSSGIIVETSIPFTIDATPGGGIIPQCLQAYSQGSAGGKGITTFSLGVFELQINNANVTWTGDMGCALGFVPSINQDTDAIRNFDFNFFVNLNNGSLIFDGKFINCIENTFAQLPSQVSKKTSILTDAVWVLDTTIGILGALGIPIPFIFGVGIPIIDSNSIPNAQLIVQGNSNIAGNLTLSENFYITANSTSSYVTFMPNLGDLGASQPQALRVFVGNHTITGLNSGFQVIGMNHPITATNTPPAASTSPTALVFDFSTSDSVISFSCPNNIDTQAPMLLVDGLTKFKVNMAYGTSFPNVIFVKSALNNTVDLVTCYGKKGATLSPDLFLEPPFDCDIQLPNGDDINVFRFVKDVTFDFVYTFNVTNPAGQTVESGVAVVPIADVNQLGGQPNGALQNDANLWLNGA